MNIIYCKFLSSNPHFKLRNFSTLIKKAVEDGKTYQIKDGVELGEVLYNVSFNPFDMELTISFEDEDGEKIERNIKVLEECSNLPSLSGSKVYYFICPRQGVKCRNLYRIGTYFWSRRAFKAYYPIQMESRHGRQIRYREEPYRKNGKHYYRDKITPYGRRCIRYEQHEEGVAEAMGEFLDHYEEKLENLRKNAR